MLLAQLDAATLIPLVDRFGFSVLTCGAFAFAIRALWVALQQKEDAHRAEREADRTAHLEKLSAIAGDVHAQGAQLAEVRRDVDRIADRVAAMVPRVAALLLLGLVLFGVACSRTVDTASQIDAQASSTSSTSSTAHQVVTGDVERSRSEAPTTTNTRKLIARFAAETFDAGDDLPPSGAPHAAPQLHAACGAHCAPSAQQVAPRPRLVELEIDEATTTTGQVLELEHAGMAAAGSSVATQATSSTAKASGQATDHVKTKAGIPWGLVLVGLAVLALAIAAVLVARKFNLVSVVAALAKRALGALGG